MEAHMIGESETDANMSQSQDSSLSPIISPTFHNQFQASNILSDSFQEQATALTQEFESQSSIFPSNLQFSNLPPVMKSMKTFSSLQPIPRKSVTSQPSRESVKTILLKLPKKINPWTLMQTLELSEMKLLCRYKNILIGSKPNKSSLSEKIFSLIKEGSFKNILCQINSKTLDTIWPKGESKLSTLSILPPHSNPNNTDNIGVPSPLKRARMPATSSMMLPDSFAENTFPSPPNSILGESDRFKIESKIVLSFGDNSNWRTIDSDLVALLNDHLKNKSHIQYDSHRNATRNLSNKGDSKDQMIYLLDLPASVTTQRGLSWEVCDAGLQHLLNTTTTAWSLYTSPVPDSENIEPLWTHGCKEDTMYSVKRLLAKLQSDCAMKLMPLATPAGTAFETQNQEESVQSDRTYAQMEGCECSWEEKTRTLPGKKPCLLLQASLPWAAKLGSEVGIQTDTSEADASQVNSSYIAVRGKQQCKDQIIPVEHEGDHIWSSFGPNTQFTNASFEKSLRSFPALKLVRFETASLGLTLTKVSLKTGEEAAVIRSKDTSSKENQAAIHLLCVGDRLVVIGNHFAQEMKFEEQIALLKSLPRPLTIGFVGNTISR